MLDCPYTLLNVRTSAELSRVSPGLDPCTPGGCRGTHTMEAAAYDFVEERHAQRRIAMRWTWWKPPMLTGLLLRRPWGLEPP